MPLPELPAPGQDPWYTSRTNWDNAVKAEFEARGVNVLSAGAVGDGTTDDSDAIRSAISSAATFGTQVWVPKRVYKVSRMDVGTAYAIGLPAGVSIVSDGATLKLAPGQLDYTSIIRPLGPGGTLQGVVLDGNRAEQSIETQKQRHGVYVSNYSDISIVNCHIMNCAGDGILVHNGSERTNIRRNRITGCARSGVAITGAAHETVMSENRIYGNDATPIDGEVEGTFARDVHISGNHLEAVPGEYALTASTAVANQRNSRWLIQGNTIVGGVYLVRSTGTRLLGNTIRTTSGTIPAVTASVTERTSIEGNIIEAFGKGIVSAHTLSVSPTNLSVVNNDITSGDSAIELAGILDGIVHLNRCVGNGVGQGIIVTSQGGNVTDVDVSDNHIRNFAAAGVYVASVGSATINGVSVTGNKFRDSDGSAMSYGVRLVGPASGFSNIRVAGNLSGSGVSIAYSDGTSGGPVPLVDGFFNKAPIVKPGDPGTATGTDAGVINALVASLRNLGLVT